MLSNYHTHTSFCDGKDSPKDIAEFAISNGFEALGFSGHSFTSFDSFGMKEEKKYISEIKALKEELGDKINIILGIEEDVFGLINRADYEYIIGSCHYVYKDGVYYPVDLSAGDTKRGIDAFGGIENFAENYFITLCDYIKNRCPDIIGHFDLLTKFDEKEGFFTENKAYKKLSQMYLQEAIKSNCIFEVNTGAISRGYRSFPYPSLDLLYTLKKNDAKIIISSDSHNKETLDYYFEETRDILTDVGFKRIYQQYDKKFIEIDLK